MKNPRKLTHIDAAGNPCMVDTSEKAVTIREAVAKGSVLMAGSTLELVISGKLAKGDVLTTARLAGITAAKQTPSLIPLCHQVILDQVAIDFQVNREEHRIEITARARCQGKTGVEMEALVAVAISALTIYDMVKAVEKTVRITDVRLITKRGGKSGDVILE